MTLVTIIWWDKQKGKLTRGNKEAFEDAGYDVEITNHPSKFSTIIFTPIPGVSTNSNIPIVTQLGGYGRNLKTPDSSISPDVLSTFENSRLVTVIDPKMVRELWSAGVDEETFVIPNASIPPSSLTDWLGIGGRTGPVEKISGEFTVFNPMGDDPMKKPEEFIEAVKIVGEEEPEIKFKMVSKSKRWRNPVEWLGVDNLEILPMQSFDGMSSLYSEADIVAHFSSAEISPWTIFEAFEMGRPVIAKEMGLIQTVDKEFIPEMIDDFGMESREFNDRWSGEYWSGEEDHFINVQTPEELTEIIMELYGDPKRRLELGGESAEWISRYGEWKPKDKGKAILEVAGIA